METGEHRPLPWGPSNTLHSVRTQALAGSDSGRLEHNDPLTGLPGRRLIEDFLSLALPLAAQKDRTLAVLCIDLGGFTRVSDQFGREAGEELLRQASARIRSSVRKSDIVALGECDEFILVLQDLDQDSETACVAAALLKRLARPFDLNGEIVRIGARVGIAVFPGDGGDGAALLRNAEIARHQAGMAGGQDIAFFDPAMQDELTTRLALDADLRLALENGDLVLHYQPVFNLPQKSVAGFEALIRWNHPEHGLIGPEVFLPAAAESGLIRRIGRWAITEACRQLADWRREGRNMAVSVNISSRQIPQGISLDWLRETLVRFGVRPSALSFEITESALLQESPELRQWLTAVGNMHIPLVLDDFGAAYASLAHLHHFNLQRIKIDTSLVRLMPGDRRAGSLVKSIIDSGKNMGLPVIAKGVESAETLAALQAMGCSLAQGFHLAPPLSAGQLPACGGCNPAIPLGAAQQWRFAPDIAGALT